MAKNKDKTNVMRILDQKKIEYKNFHYETDNTLSGLDVAHLLGKDPSSVFKTLVTVCKSGEHYVFVIAVDQELNLKLAAAAVGEKSIQMLPSRELLGLTGYIHGGCSPIGMKKQFTTVFDEEISRHESITFSGGKVGYQVELKVEDLAKIIDYRKSILIEK